MDTQTGGKYKKNKGNPNVQLTPEQQSRLSSLKGVLVNKQTKTGENITYNMLNYDNVKKYLQQKAIHENDESIGTEEKISEILGQVQRLIEVGPTAKTGNPQAKESELLLLGEDDRIVFADGDSVPNIFEYIKNNDTFEFNKEISTLKDINQTVTIMEPEKNPKGQNTSQSYNQQNKGKKGKKGKKAGGAEEESSSEEDEDEHESSSEDESSSDEEETEDESSSDEDEVMKGGDFAHNQFTKMGIPKVDNSYKNTYLQTAIQLLYSIPFLPGVIGFNEDVNLTNLSKVFTKLTRNRFDITTAESSNDITLPQQEVDTELRQSLSIILNNFLQKEYFPEGYTGTAEQRAQLKELAKQEKSILKFFSFFFKTVRSIPEINISKLNISNSRVTECSNQTNVEDAVELLNPPIVKLNIEDYATKKATNTAKLQELIDFYQQPNEQENIEQCGPGAGTIQNKLIPDSANEFVMFFLDKKDEQEFSLYDKFLVVPDVSILINNRLYTIYGIVLHRGRTLSDGTYKFRRFQPDAKEQNILRIKSVIYDGERLEFINGSNEDILDPNNVNATSIKKNGIMYIYKLEEDITLHYNSISQIKQSFSAIRPDFQNINKFLVRDINKFLSQPGITDEIRNRLTRDRPLLEQSIDENFTEYFSSEEKLNLFKNAVLLIFFMKNKRQEISIADFLADNEQNKTYKDVIIPIRNIIKAPTIPPPPPVAPEPPVIPEFATTPEYYASFPDMDEEFVKLNVRTALEFIQNAGFSNKEITAQQILNLILIPNIPSTTPAFNFKQLYNVRDVTNTPAFTGTEIDQTRLRDETKTLLKDHVNKINKFSNGDAYLTRNYESILTKFLESEKRIIKPKKPEEIKPGSFSSGRMFKLNDVVICKDPYSINPFLKADTFKVQNITKKETSLGDMFLLKGTNILTGKQVEHQEEHCTYPAFERPVMGFSSIDRNIFTEIGKNNITAVSLNNLLKQKAFTDKTSLKDKVTTDVYDIQKPLDGKPINLRTICNLVKKAKATLDPNYTCSEKGDYDSDVVKAALGIIWRKHKYIEGFTGAFLSLRKEQKGETKDYKIGNEEINDPIFVNLSDNSEIENHWIVLRKKENGQYDYIDPLAKNEEVKNYATLKDFEDEKFEVVKEYIILGELSDRYINPIAEIEQKVLSKLYPGKATEVSEEGVGVPKPQEKTEELFRLKDNVSSAVVALNNLVKYEAFTEGSEYSTTNLEDTRQPIELQGICQFIEPFMLDLKSDFICPAVGSDYDEYVLVSALNFIGYDVAKIDNIRSKSKIDKDYDAFFAKNSQDNWVVFVRPNKELQNRYVLKDTVREGETPKSGVFSINLFKDDDEFSNNTVIYAVKIPESENPKRIDPRETLKPILEKEAPGEKVETTQTKIKDEIASSAKKAVETTDSSVPEDQIKFTPLQLAVISGTPEMVRELIENNADFKVKARGNTLKQLLETYGRNNSARTAIVKKILEVVNQAELQATIDIRKKAMDTEYGKSFDKNADVANFVYKKTFESFKRKKGKFSDSEASLSGKPLEAFRIGVKDGEGLVARKPEYKDEASAPSPAEFEAYHKGYNLASAKARGTQDAIYRSTKYFNRTEYLHASEKQLEPNGELQKLYEEGFNSLEKTAYEDGAAGKVKKVIDAGSGSLGLDESLGGLIGLTPGSITARNVYNKKYEEGLAVFKKNVDVLKKDARSAGETDGRTEDLNDKGSKKYKTTIKNYIDENKTKTVDIEFDKLNKDVKEAKDVLHEYEEGYRAGVYAAAERTSGSIVPPKGGLTKRNRIPTRKTHKSKARF